MAQRTIVGLLAVIAVMLALNLAASLPGQRANAQPVSQWPSPTRLVAAHGQYPSFSFHARLWSDGGHRGI